MVAAFLHNVKILLNVRSNLARRFFFFALHAVSSKAPPAGERKVPYSLAEKKNSIGGKKMFPFRGKNGKKKKSPPCFCDVANGVQQWLFLFQRALPFELFLNKVRSKKSERHKRVNSQ